jgi:flagellar motor switch protein FliN
MDVMTQAEHTLTSVPLPPVAPRSYQWEELDRGPATTHGSGARGFFTESLTLRIELGRTHLPPEELLKLRKGAVVPLDQGPNELVDLYANGRLAGRGEVVVLDGRFGVRVVELKKL